MTSFVFDVETSGLFPRGACYKKLQDFNNARLLSICWIISQGDSIIEQAYFVVKPDTWTISDESIGIHGITNEYAQEHGLPVTDILMKMSKVVKRCERLVAHNIQFDETIIKSELFRSSMMDDLDEFQGKHKVCTMVKGRQYMNVKKYPKLSELYRFLYEEDITNAHNAVYDTKYCYLCFKKLFPSDPNIFYFGNKPVSLNLQQSGMVFDEKATNMLIIAGAGSGKTTSMISRIKYVLNQGASENSILLTTFTRNAANDIREKLFEIMGYMCDIHVGTFDSIAKFHVMKYDEDVQHIQEYAPKFLELIQNNPKIIQKFKYFFVDEVQDINNIQHQIMLEFYKNGCFIIGIGDDSQNIYEFRGTDIKYIREFKDTFTPCETHFLTKNYRSTSAIVSFANSIIDKNRDKIPKQMVSTSELGGNPPIILGFNDCYGQYDYVIESLKTIGEFESVCVMSWINKPLVEFQAVLKKHCIPHIYNLDDDSSGSRSTYRVNLNTIHKSKGLEWDHVFLISMNNDINDNVRKYHRQEKDVQKKIEANRRLFYVGATRAKKQLFVLSDSWKLIEY